MWDNLGKNPDNLFIKPINKWWDGYKNQEIVLIEDWDKTHRILAHHIKIWADRYRFTGEMKGSSRVIRPKLIVITSNYRIDECFEGPDIDAIKRRFIEVRGKPEMSFPDNASADDILKILADYSNTGAIVDE